MTDEETPTQRVRPGSLPSMMKQLSGSYFTAQRRRLQKSQLLSSLARKAEPEHTESPVKLFLCRASTKCSAASTSNGNPTACMWLFLFSSLQSSFLENLFSSLAPRGCRSPFKPLGAEGDSKRLDFTRAFVLEPLEPFQTRVHVRDQQGSDFTKKDAGKLTGSLLGLQLTVRTSSGVTGILYFQLRMRF